MMTMDGVRCRKPKIESYRSGYEHAISLRAIQGVVGTSAHCGAGRYRLAAVDEGRLVRRDS